MTNEIAQVNGLTKRVTMTCEEFEMELMVSEDADLDGTFEAWDITAQEYINVNGWNFHRACEWLDGAYTAEPQFSY